MHKKNYLTYIHALRGLAILMIVSVHTRGYREYWENNYNSFQLLQVLFDNSTYIFLFIGGFLFKYIYVNSFDYKLYLIKKFQYVFIPYVLMSIPAIIIRIVTDYIPYALNENFLNWPLWLKITYFFVTGSHLVPLWFMPMIFIFYLVSPILIKLDNKNFYTYVLPILLFLNFFTFRPQYNLNPILSFIHFFPVYMFGMWACRNRDKITSMGWRLGIPLLIIYTIISTLEYYELIEANRNIRFETAFTEGKLFFNIVQLKLTFLSIVLLIVFYKMRNLNLRLLSLMGTYSFGIYFIHHYFYALVRTLLKSIGFTDVLNFWSFIILTVIVVFFSSAAVYILQKIFKKRSRYIIGS